MTCEDPATLARAATSLAAKERYAATLLADDALLLRQFAACFDDAEDADDVAAFNSLKDTFNAYEPKVAARMADISSVLDAGGYSFNDVRHLHLCEDED